MPNGRDTIFQTLLAAGYECYLVGGSVRDLLLGRSGGDLDFTTNARPPDVLRLFARSHYPNSFGTVLVDLGGTQYEITTYRGEGRYSDRRHPDQIDFVDRLEDDLKRRDFTMNAMAMDVHGTLVDPFGGERDLRQRLLRAVGDPVERLTEDPLRMMRAARLATQLSFTIEAGTWQAIVAHAQLLSAISRERVRDELLKLLASDHPVTGIDLLDHLGLLPDILPELAAIRRLNRPPLEELNAYQHALATLRCCAGDALLRLAALLHVLDEAVNPQPSAVDAPAVATDEPLPPAAFPRGAEGDEVTRALERLRFSSAQVERVSRLVAAVPSLPDDLAVSAAAARRLLSAHGALLPDLLLLVEAHRLALGRRSRPNLRQPRRLRRLVQQVQRQGQPVTLAGLAINGNDLRQELGLPEGPAVGRLLRQLLDRVLDEPSLNTRETLLRAARSMARR